MGILIDGLAYLCLVACGLVGIANLLHWSVERLAGAGCVAVARTERRRLVALRESDRTLMANLIEENRKLEEAVIRFRELSRPTPTVKAKPNVFSQRLVSAKAKLPNLAEGTA